MSPAGTGPPGQEQGEAGSGLFWSAAKHAAPVLHSRARLDLSALQRAQQGDTDRGQRLLLGCSSAWGCWEARAGRMGARHQHREGAKALGTCWSCCASSQRGCQSRAHFQKQCLNSSPSRQALKPAAATTAGRNLRGPGTHSPLSPSTNPTCQPLASQLAAPAAALPYLRLSLLKAEGNGPTGGHPKGLFRVMQGAKSIVPHRGHRASPSTLRGLLFSS